MGKNNIERCETENIVALCDVDFAKAAEVFEKYPDAKRYKDFRVMLDEQKDIDAVIVATPDHTHAVVAMAAMERKKHVYVQKPLTHSVSEARLLTETARKHGVVTQMGNQGHSGEGARILCEWVQDGAIGPVREVHAWTNRPVWPSGHRGRPAHGDARRSRRTSTGTCGSVRPRPGRTTPPITPPSGAPGGTSGPARWATWGATSSTRSSGR